MLVVSISVVQGPGELIQVAGYVFIQGTTHKHANRLPGKAEKIKIRRAKRESVSEARELER